jgi:pyrimidine deaminase RibD-like protein
MYRNQIPPMSVAEFCGSFFHVPEICYGRSRYMICVKNCLKNRSCIIGQRRKPKSQPRTVKALVVLRKGNTEVYSARVYKNYWSRSTTRHAEEFFEEDVRLGNLGKELREIRRFSTSDPLEMYMYITYQPCHYSTRKTPGKSCSDLLVKLNQEVFKRWNIKFVVKPTLIYYKVGVYY